MSQSAAKSQFIRVLTVFSLEKYGIRDYDYLKAYMILTSLTIPNGFRNRFANGTDIDLANTHRCGAFCD